VTSKAHAKQKGSLEYRCELPPHPKTLPFCRNQSDQSNGKYMESHMGEEVVILDILVDKSLLSLVKLALSFVVLQPAVIATTLQHFQKHVNL
jgi:hypothetical protein